MIANIMEKRTVYFLAAISVGGLIVVAFTKYYREITPQNNIILCIIPLIPVDANAPTNFKHVCNGIDGGAC